MFFHIIQGKVITLDRVPACSPGALCFYFSLEYEIITFEINNAYKLLEHITSLSFPLKSAKLDKLLSFRKCACVI